MCKKCKIPKLPKWKLFFVIDVELPGQIFILTLLPMICFFGISGIFSECILPIFLYIVLSTSTAVVFAIAGIKGIVQENYAVNQMIQEISSSFQKRNQSDRLDHQWKELQAFFNCCGVNGPENYEQPEINCGMFERASIGCADAVYTWTSELLTRCGIGGIIVGAFMLILDIWAMAYTTKHFFCRTFSCRSSVHGTTSSGSASTS